MNHLSPYMSGDRVAQHTWTSHPRNQCCAAIAAPMVGENKAGARCRSFHSVTSRKASALTCGLSARFAAACFSASCRRSSSSVRLLLPTRTPSGRLGQRSQSGRDFDLGFPCLPKLAGDVVWKHTPRGRVAGAGNLASDRGGNELREWPEPMAEGA